MARFAKPGLLVIILLIAACQTTPPERALQLPAGSLDIRQMQTRRFADISEAQLLAAGAGVLQDLGFNIDESEVELGLIVASKRILAGDPGVSQVMKLLEIFADIEITVDRDQRIRVSLVSWPVSGADEEHFVRVTFQRVVWNTENDISKRETLDDPILYREFFERLSKSVFLEAHSI
jgi:hypothetical protein